MEEKDIQRALQREYIPYYAMEEGYVCIMV